MLCVRVMCVFSLIKSHMTPSPITWHSPSRMVSSQSHDILATRHLSESKSHFIISSRMTFPSHMPSPVTLHLSSRMVFWVKVIQHLTSNDMDPSQSHDIFSHMSSSRSHVIICSYMTLSPSTWHPQLNAILPSNMTYFSIYMTSSRSQDFLTVAVI